MRQKLSFPSTVSSCCCHREYLFVANPLKTVLHLDDKTESRNSGQAFILYPPLTDVKQSFTIVVNYTTQCAKDCSPHNRACEYSRECFCGLQFLEHAVFCKYL